MPPAQSRSTPVSIGAATQFVSTIRRPNFFARQSGSSLFLDGADTDALIPVGTSGATLSFAGGDGRTLLLDTGIPGITVAGQPILNDPVQLMAL